MKIVVLGGLPLSEERTGYLNHVDKLTDAISRTDNIEVHVISLGKKSGYFRKNKVNVHIMNDSCLSMPWLLPVTIHSIIRKIKSINPDIVHGCGGIPYITVAALLTNEYPSVISLFSISAKDVFYDKRNIFNIIGKVLVAIPNERYVISRISHIIVQSNFTENHIKKWTKSKIYIVPEGIEGEQIHQKEPQAPHIFKCDIFIAVALRWWKGLDILIKAIPQILERVPDLRVCIAGSGPEEKKLKKLVNQLDINEHVNFLGYISDEEIIQSYYKNCRIVVAPSRWDVEPFAPLNAASFGKPSIVSEMCNSSWVKDGETGFVIKSEDYEDLAKKATLLLTDKQLRESMGNAAKVRINEYNWENIVDKTIAVYRMVIDDFNLHRNANQRTP